MDQGFYFNRGPRLFIHLFLIMKKMTRAINIDETFTLQFRFRIMFFMFSFKIWIIEVLQSGREWNTKMQISLILFNKSNQRRDSMTRQRKA